MNTVVFCNIIIPLEAKGASEAEDVEVPIKCRL